MDPKTVFEPHIEPKNSPLGPQKVKNDPVRIEENKENESSSSIRVDPKLVFEPNIEPKNSPLGPQKEKMTLSELKEIKKIKVVALYE